MSVSSKIKQRGFSVSVEQRFNIVLEIATIYGIVWAGAGKQQRIKIYCATIVSIKNCDESSSEDSIKRVAASESSGTDFTWRSRSNWFLKVELALTAAARARGVSVASDQLEQRFGSLIERGF